MLHKITIGLLVLLAILIGGLGYYSHTLNLEVNSLMGQLTTFQTEQTSQIDAISDNITTFKEENLARIDGLSGKINENLTKITVLEGEIGEILTAIGTLENEIDKTAARVITLESKIEEMAVLSRSVLDANQIYQNFGQATVRISDGVFQVGSGFILDDEAHVLTAYHVIDDLDEIYVILSDGRTYLATETGSSAQSDIAVLTLEDNPAIEPPVLADSSNVRIGQPVVAIGNPFDISKAITTGIVSQTDQVAEIYNTQPILVANLIQFDAAVNSGNSGGLLVNSSSEIIGMVIARIEPERGDGIYWAVSSNKLKRVADAIISEGKFNYPWLGVGLYDITPEMVQTKDLGTINGVIVGEVWDESPAKDAGIKVDDIIMAINDVPTDSRASLISYLGEHLSAEDITTFIVLRGGILVELSLEIGIRPLL